MNLASWIILGVVIVILALAIRATFFRKKRKRGGCCDVGDADTGGKTPSPTCPSGCTGCSMASKLDSL